MSKLDKLYRLFEHGHITPEEYEKKREYYEQRQLELYLKGEITLTELIKRIDK